MSFYSLFRVLLLYSFFIINIKKISLLDINKISSDNVNECQRCKLLTDSFNHWLEKTSRGKYEGGDAAWEETKLKSYSRSEMRLVEVQEGLCSDMKTYQDHCYALAEEAEQPLEKWWYHEDPNSVDLYTWLCVETLQYCCPNNHFGEMCVPCPMIKNKVCGGNGYCDGEGTRKGNGTCVCKRGYAGKYCEDCANNFYREAESCKPCHKACNGCSGKSANNCDACKSGWQLESGSCIDINECYDSSTCAPNQFCVNREGSYACKMCDTSCKSCLGEGSSNCSSCEQTHVLWMGMCLDNELKNDILASALKRAVLYTGMLIITLIIFRTSKPLASLIILVIAVYIYFSEKTSKMHIADILLNMYSENFNKVN